MLLRARLLALLPLLACPVLSPANQVDDGREFRVGIHLVSHHWPDRRPSGRPWNNENWGAYIHWNSGPTIGGYENSYGRRSYYAGWTFESAPCGPAATVALVSGYNRKDPSQLRPFVLPSLCMADHVRVFATPRVGKTPALVHLGLEF